MDTSDATGFSVPDVNEDSVDIYDGLDIGFSSNAESSQDASKLKESMDLYEEIVTEEQRNKEISYAELKSRFQAAQNQIKELRRRLEEMEIQNTRLNAENCSLKKNISALFRTAKQEVARKDAEIQRLNQRSMKGHNQFHINNLQDRNSSSKPPPSSPPPPQSSISTPPPPLPTLPTKENQPAKDPPQLSNKESNNSINQPTGFFETRTSTASSHCHSKTFHNESDKHKSKHREEKYESRKLSQSTDRKHRTGSDSNKDCHAPEKNRCHKADKDTGRKHDFRSCRSKTYLNAEGHNSSDRGKSPPPKISAVSSVGTTGSTREHRQDKAKLVMSDSEHSTAHISKERSNRDRRKHYRHSRSYAEEDSKDRIKSSSNQKAERYWDSSKDREGERLSKDYQKKVEKRREDEISRKHKRSSLSEISREREKLRAKKTDQCEVDVCSNKRQENKHQTLEGSSKEQNTTRKSSVEESSPNKKLCFMETLNLTLSPIKKPTIPMDNSQDGPAVEKAVENQPDDDDSQSNVEDMCVIDEVDSSEVEAGLEDFAEQTLGIPESTHKTCDDVKDAQKEDTSCRISETGKPLEANSVKTTSTSRQPPDTAHNAMSHPTPTSPQGSSPTLQINNSQELVSDSQVDQSGPLEVTDTDSFSYTSRNISKRHTSTSSNQGNHGSNAEQSVAINEHVVSESRVEPPKTTVQTSLSVDSVEHGTTDSPSRESPVAEDLPGSPKNQSVPPPVLPQSSQQGPSPPASTISVYKKEVCDTQTAPKDAVSVSSTISLESLPQEGLSLPEAIYILTQTSEGASDSLAIEPSSSTSCIGVSKVSSTTEETILPERYSELIFTPKKNFSTGKRYESNIEPSSSVPLLHDEDSMMHTLSNLKRFPDAISPLKSPIRITKRSHVPVHGKPGHVKSLQTDFSNTSVDVNSKKLDVNKENKYPGSPANSDMQNMIDRTTDHLSSLCDVELEEGEILSESEEAAPDSLLQTTKTAKMSPPVKGKSGHKTVLKRKSEECCLTSKETSETTDTSTRSPKNRFKTVCPAATKISFSNIEEIMETFKLVRCEIRKKYMKLHKTFPKKSFYGMMNNFQESFLEFVDGAQFGEICNQAGELKSKLKKLIASVFSKVSNNGIVRRIFEQQATDLKQKLWDFVDVQVDYLFKDIHTTLISLCKPAEAQAKDMRLSGNGSMSRQPSVKKSQCQQRETQPDPTSLSRLKTSAVVPYRTGLGSRGKDIRITHMEKDTNVVPRPANHPNTQTAVDFLSPKKVHPTPEKNNMVSLIVSQNGSLLDKTDFDILTEQQASSLTFNLVRDSQMGEIFKCLLQGSDLLETSGITGDSTGWSLSTPRKDGETLISITTPTKFDSPSKLLSPNKFDTPSKLIATWSSISPRKMSSPRSKHPVPLNPALFDESCLLEVPSENRLMLQSSIPPRKSYSILAEDLAVSLTIPSPLKSDSHLSFLQPSSMHIMSTPDSVISAHISEDALLDGEDATEQDIHLTLDTDNSSCNSNSSMVSVARATSFVFQPDKPMQALVMEKSNDHFIVKIRQAATADVTLTANDSLSETLREEDEQHCEEDMDQETHKESQVKAVLSDKSHNSNSPSDAVPSVWSNYSKSSEMCQAIIGSYVCLSQDESLTLRKHSFCQKEDTSTQQSTSNVCFPEESQSLKNQPEAAPSENSLQTGAQSSESVFMQITTQEGVTLTADESTPDPHHGEEDIQAQSSSSETLISATNTVISGNNSNQPAESCKTNQRNQTSLSQCSDMEREEMEVSGSERSLIIAEDVSSTPETDLSGCDKSRKRKKCQEKSKVKRRRKEEQDDLERTEAVVSRKDNYESHFSPTPLSPNSVSAKNVVRKKGEVVVAWTRDEDRAILMDLKTKGPSRETFSALSEKLNKPSGQIAHRFYQLMKLFKKQEKTDT